MLARLFITAFLAIGLVNAGKHESKTTGTKDVSKDGSKPSDTKDVSVTKDGSKLSDTKDGSGAKDLSKDVSKDVSKTGKDKVAPKTKPKCDATVLKTAKESLEKCFEGGSEAMAKCKEKFSSSSKSGCGGQDMSSDDVKAMQGEAARKALAMCKMSGKSECDTKFDEMMGRNSTGKKDAKDQIRDKFDSDRGTKEAMATAMTACKTSGKDMAACKTEMEGKLKNMTGKSLSKGEFETEMRKAGKSAGASKMQECLDAANTTDAKKTCFKSSDALEAFASASGMDKSKIKEADLKRAYKDKAQTDVKEVVRNCVEAATDEATKTACFKTTDLKDKIAGARGVGADKIKDSDVRDFAMKGARDDVLGVMKSCNKTAEASKCKELAKQMKAGAMGKNAADITDNDLRRDSRDAMKGEVAEKMEACMAAATTDDEKSKCKDLIKEAMKAGNLDGKEPSKTKVEEMVRDSAKKKAGDMMKDCASGKGRNECVDQAKERIAAVMGKDKSKITSRDTEKFIKDGALSDMKDKALACVQAKKADGESATCDNLYDKMNEAQKKEKPTRVSKQKQEQSKTNLNVVAELKKSNLKTCMEHDTKAKVDECLAEFKSLDDDVAKEFLKGAGQKATDKVLEARKKQADSKAKTDYIGELYKACIQSNSTKEECKSEVEAKMTLAGVKGKQEDVMKKFRAKEVAEAVSLCNSTERKSCMKAAKDEMIQGGLEPRKYNQVKKIGEFTSAAEVYATCLQGDSNQTECAALAKEEYESVSGSTLDVSGDMGKKLMAKIQALGNGIESGAEVVLRKKAQLMVDALVNADLCQSGVGGALVAKIKTVKVGLTKNLTGFKNGTCRIADGKAEYSAQVGVGGFNETEVATASATINAGLDGADLTPSRRLLGRLLAEVRRLAQVSEVYTDQETEACAETDASCGETEPAFLDGVPTTTTTTTTTTTVTTTTVTTTTVTTTTVAGTTTTVAGTTTTVASGNNAGGNDVATTTTTVTSAATTTTTTVAGAAATGKTFSSKVVLTVANAAAFVASPSAKRVMQDAIVASNADITAANMVTITRLAVARRLGEAAAALRRLTSGAVHCEFDVKFPTAYTGSGLTATTDFDTAAMKDKIQNNAHGVNVTVTAVVPQAPTCKSGCGSSTGSGSGSAGTESTAGAGNMRSGISAIVMLFTLGFAVLQ